MGLDSIRCKYKVKARSNYNMSRLAIIQIEKQFTILLSWKNPRPHSEFRSILKHS